MKNLIKKSAIIILLSIMAINLGFSNQSYKLNISNLKYTSDKSLEFDIYMMNTNSDEKQLYYLLGQYFLDFNPKISNGGSLKYTLTGSGLPESMRPRNASIFENQLRLACNAVSVNKNNLPIVSRESPGLLIAHMTLETTADKFSPEQLNLNWSHDANNFTTKIFSYEGNKIVEITNAESFTVDQAEGNEIVQKNNAVPAEYYLAQNYPNPFNPVSTIKFDIPQDGLVSLKVFDITGKEVMNLVNEFKNAGSYKAVFNGADFSSGIYFYKLESGSFVQTKKMLLVK